MGLLKALGVSLGLRADDTDRNRPHFERVGVWWPHGVFRNVEQRTILVTLESCPHTFNEYRRKRPLPMVTQEDVATLKAIIEKPFNWLEEYGPLWEPGSPAFWLAPTTPDELASWYAKYRYGEDGVFSADNIVHGGVIISVTANADRQRAYQEAEQRRLANAARRYQNSNHLAQAGLNNQLAAMQQQAWAGLQAEQLQNTANALHYGNRRFLGRLK